jgi:oligoribonuclease NrnB/cAMP/cGMP phosphodiesterase (DHH superfamily)
MKTVCVYHSVDLDGWMSAAIVKHWFLTKSPKPCMTGINLEDYPNKVLNSESCGNWNVLDFLGYNYGQPIPDLSEYDKVIMCDISFPKEEMLNLWTTKGLNFEWIDHHISAIKIMENAHENISSGAYPIQGLRDTNYAACELTWQYFFPNDPMPEIVRLLGRWDCFGSIGTDEEQKVVEFQYGARAVIKNYDDAYYYLDRSINSEKYYGDKDLVDKNIYTKGQSIYEYLCTEAKQTYKNGFEIKFEYPIPDAEIYGTNTTKVKFICINKERFNPINFGIDYHADGYDGAACFWYDGKQWNFSLYNSNGEVDCSQVAKQFEGGGHKSAAGFNI